MWNRKFKRLAVALDERAVQTILGSEENPISIEELIAVAPVEIRSRIESILVKFYKDPRKCDYPLFPQFLSIAIMKFGRIKYFTQLEKKLKADNRKLATVIGFERDENGEIKVPSDKNFWYFVKIRIGEKKIDLLLAEILKLLNETAKRKEVKFGTVVGQDPIKYESEDKEAVYNGHYKTRMYKAQLNSCLDTLIPLYGEMTEGTRYAGGDLITYTNKVRESGITIKRVCADGEFDEIENFAILNGILGIESYISIDTPEKIPETEKGIRKKVKETYQKYWAKENFNPNATTEEMSKFLAQKGDLEISGRYYRNKYRREIIKHPETFYPKFHKRSLEETVNSRILDPAMFSPETTCNGTGKRNQNIHWKWCVLSIQILALIRMYYGARKDFISVKGIAF